MVLIEEVKNKEGEILKTQDGKTLKEYKLELGDEFIPTINKVLKKENTYKNEKGVDSVAVNYSIPALVRDKTGEQVKGETENGSIFLTLTPTQAKVLEKLKLEDVNITQELFNTYTYKNSFGTQLGIGIKGNFKPSKTFDDFDKSEEEEVEGQEAQ